MNVMNFVVLNEFSYHFIWKNVILFPWMMLSSSFKVILFSEVEKILPYYQCFDLLENGDNQSTFITALTTSSSLSISSKIPITPQEAQECISFFQRYFISGYENKDQNYERALIPYMYQMFMVKRKNFKKNLGFILSGM